MLVEKKYGFTIDEHWVEINGQSGLIHPTWSLHIDEELVDSQKKSGKFELKGEVGDHSVTVEIDHGSFGSVTIVVKKDGKKIEMFEGYLA